VGRVVEWVGDTFELAGRVRTLAGRVFWGASLLGGWLAFAVATAAFSGFVPPRLVALGIVALAITVGLLALSRRPAVARIATRRAHARLLGVPAAPVARKTAGDPGSHPTVGRTRWPYASQPKRIRIACRPAEKQRPAATKGRHQTRHIGRRASLRDCPIVNGGVREARLR
jgi:hypothetical protein